LNSCAARSISWVKAAAAGRIQYPLHVRQQVLLLGDLFHQRPQLAAVAEKIVVRVHQQQAGVLPGIRIAHGISFAK
jgi:hypothetical protein